MQERDLAMFQDKLLKTLWTQDDPEVIMNCLEAESPSELMADYVREIDPRMVALAAELVNLPENLPPAFRIRFTYPSHAQTDDL